VSVHASGRARWFPAGSRALNVGPGKETVMGLVSSKDKAEILRRVQKAEQRRAAEKAAKQAAKAGKK